MALTQSEALTRVRDRLREASAREWSDDMLRRWINDALRDIARTVEYAETTATVAIVAGTQSYSLAAITPAIARIHRVEFKATGDNQIYPLEYEDYSNLDSIWGGSKAVSLARPECWTAWGATPNISFLLYPKPSMAGTLTLYYYAIPSRLSETDTSSGSTTLSIPDGWEDLIIDFTEYHALRRDRDQRWQEAKQFYDDKLQHMMNMTSRHSDQAGRMVSTGFGAVPGWLASGSEY